MHQRSSQEPRYKRSTKHRELRHAESNEYFDSTSSSSEEEEEESVARYTDDTEESVASLSYQRSSKERFLERRACPYKSYNCEKFYYNPYINCSRVSKRDKFTQKNLLSPFQSYWEAPLQKEVAGNTNCRISNVMPIPEKQHRLYSAEKTITKKEFHHKKDDLANRFCPEVDKNWDRHIPGKDKYVKETIQADSNGRDVPGKILKPVPDNFPKPLEELITSRKPKMSAQNTGYCSQSPEACPEYLPAVENRPKSKRKPDVVTPSCEKELKPPETVCGKDIEEDKSVKKKGKEVKEKLVYVVEEEGRNPTKIETDIFSLNEILAIKKDLIELSEFAKKLKRLKEMKKGLENDQSKKSSCHCHKAEELLKDVNKRIEMLEARQEELEKKSLLLESMESKSNSKTLTKPKTSTTIPPVVAPNLSAEATGQIDPKTKILETGAESFTCSSNLAKELMEIKIQLEKLEKKRMLKQVSTETVSQKEETYLTKTEPHAVAVFSSKTYIVLTENIDKNGDEKLKNDLINENVNDWLRNVSSERRNTKASVFLTDPLRNETCPGKKEQVEEYIIHRNSLGNNENKEKSKNKKLGSLKNEVDMSITCFVKNQYTEESSQLGEQKQNIMTSSGKFVAVMSKSSESLKKNFQILSSSTTNESSKIVHRSASNGSIPSAILIKKQLKKLKSHLKRKKHRNEVKEVRSKSTTELVEKQGKSSSRKVKNIEKTDVINSSTKQGKNEFLKRLEAQFLALAKNLGMIDPSTTSCNYSEFLDSVDLETVDFESKHWPVKTGDNKIIMYSEQCRRRHRPRRRCSRSRLDRCDQVFKKVKRRREDRCRKPKRKVKKIKIHRAKTCHYYEHDRCRYCLLLHPWHPPCKQKKEKPSCCSPEYRALERENPRRKYNRTGRTECYSGPSCSRRTPECCFRRSKPLFKEPPPCERSISFVQSQDAVKTDHSESTEEQRKHYKKHCGMVNPNLNFDPSRVKRFFRYISRFNSKTNEKCPPPPKLGASAGTFSSVSQPSDLTLCSSYSPECDSHSKCFLYQPPPRQGRPRRKPSPQSFEPQQRETRQRRSEGGPCPLPPRPPRNPPHPSSGHPRHRPSCVCQTAGAADEDRNWLGTPFLSPFELVNEENASKKKNIEKVKESESEFPKANKEVFIVNPLYEDPETDCHRFSRNSVLCTCLKCGNVHRRGETRITTDVIDQKQLNCNLKHLETNDPSFGRAIREKCEEKYRREYDNYGDYTFDYKFDKYDVRTLGYKSYPNLGFHPPGDFFWQQGYCYYNEYNLTNLFPKDYKHYDDRMTRYHESYGSRSRDRDPHTGHRSSSPTRCKLCTSRIKVDRSTSKPTNSNRKRQESYKFKPQPVVNCSEPKPQIPVIYLKPKPQPPVSCCKPKPQPPVICHKPRPQPSIYCFQLKRQPSAISCKRRPEPCRKFKYRLPVSCPVNLCSPPPPSSPPTPPSPPVFPSPPMTFFPVTPVTPLTPLAPHKMQRAPDCGYCNGFRLNYNPSRLLRFFFKRKSKKKCCFGANEKNYSESLFMTFFGNICKMGSRKVTGSELEQKFQHLETRLTEVERGLVKGIHEVTPPLAPHSQVKPSTPPTRASPPSSRQSQCRMTECCGHDRPKVGRSEFGREQEVLEKRMRGGTWVCWNDLERKDKMKGLNKMKNLKVSDVKRLRDYEGAAFCCTIDTPPKTSTDPHHMPEGKKPRPKSRFRFSRKINEGLNSLHNLWDNIRNSKLRRGMGDLVNRMRIKSLTECECSTRNSQTVFEERSLRSETRFKPKYKTYRGRYS